MSVPFNHSRLENYGVEHLFVNLWLSKVRICFLQSSDLLVHLFINLKNIHFSKVMMQRIKLQFSISFQLQDTESCNWFLEFFN
jgi:hypothetical protein